MAIWNTDLTTEDGALGAAQMGGAACFVAAGLSLLSLVLMLGMIRTGAAAPLVGLAALIEAGLFLVAGFRLRAGKGVAWGGAAVAMLALELLFKLVALAISIGLLINVILLIFTINGIRGALALRKGAFDAEEVAAIFE